MQGLIEEQYILSKYAHISLSESDELPDFERQAYLAMVIRDLKKENQRNSFLNRT